MVESALPSKARRAARLTRRHIHHQARSRTRVSVAAIRRVGDDMDDRGFVEKAAIAEMVADRRYADKLAPIERWAVRLVAKRPGLARATLKEQLSYFRRLLPDNTVGRHALGHIEFALEWT